MRTSKFATGPLTASFCVSALLGLTTVLTPVQNARAQNCSVSIADGPGIPDEKFVHVGDTVHFFIHLNADASVCILDGGTNWAIIPDGTVHQIVNDYNRNACGTTLTIDCPGGPGCTGDVPTENGPSGFLRFKYGPIQPADVGRALPLFTTPRGSVFTAQLGLPLLNQIWMGAITDARSTDCNDPNTHDKAVGQGVAHVTVVTPSITVTKFCVTNCPPNNSAVFGTPINIGGTICNNGDIALTNVSVSDNVGGTTISYATTTTMGNAFPATGAGRLIPGDCVNYTGSFTPTDNGCGPYPDTVTACGTDQSSIPKQVCASASATCTVCTTPCISVTKNCDTVVIGSANTVSGVVSNCGNITLQNIVITDNIYGQITTVASLAPHTSQSYSKLVTNNTCGNFPNTVTATGTGLCGGQVSATATATCVVTESPCIRVTKNCDTVLIGSANTVSGVVSNCGNVTLQNIVITDNIYGQITTVASLAPGASQSYSKSVTNSTCGNFPNTVTATGTGLCGDQVSATATATCVVQCAPKICVTKEVACELPTGCGSYSEVAIAAKSADNSQCPSFCYRVRVTNCGQEALNNVTVVDNVLNLAACNFPPTLAVGQTVECIVAGVVHCQNVTNTVTAAGVGASSGIGVSTNDTAAVVVLPISITCNVTVNGKPNETIPCDGQGHLITNAVEVCNTGSLPLSDIAINAPDIVALGGDCTNVANLRLSLLPGQCTNVVLCTDLVTCPPSCGLAFSNHIHITATVDQTLTNVCTWTRNQSNQVVAITASTECSAVVECLPPPHTGCTPGFWKNCTIHWQLTGYSTDQSVSSVFSLGNCCTSLGNSSLLGALSFQGGSGVCGGAQILLRTGVGALLNAASPEVDYPFSAQEIIAMANAALQSCNRETMIALASEFDRDNNLGCRGANGNDLPCHRLSDVPRVAPARDAGVLRSAPTRVVDDPRVAPTRQ